LIVVVFLRGSGGIMATKVMHFGRAKNAIVGLVAGSVPTMLVTVMLFAVATQVHAQVPAGWKTVKDRSGRCQASVPGDWTIGGGVLASSASGPNYRSAGVFAGVQEDARKGMSEEKLHSLGATTIFDNTPKTTFFAGTATKQSGKVPSLLKYTAQVAGKPACTVQVTVPTGQDEPLVRQIVASLGPVK
jgi:hypothetical protein